MIRLDRGAVVSGVAVALLAACASTPPAPTTTAAAPMPACAGAVADTAVYTFDQVDVPPAYRSGPAPLYPPDLRRQGVNGRVTLSYVVQGDGTVDASTLAVTKSTNPAFEAPSLTMMRATQFWPGCRGGKPVRTRVQQSVAFETKTDGGQ